MGPGAETASTRILESNPTYTLAEFENCLITDWRLQPSEADFQRRNVALADLVARRPRECGYLEMIEPTSKPPTAPVRKVGMDGFRAAGKNLACVALVVHGTEIRVTFVRAILTGMTFFVPQFQALRVFKRTEEAATWIQSQLRKDAAFERSLLVAAESLRPVKPVAA